MDDGREAIQRPSGRLAWIGLLLLLVVLAAGASTDRVALWRSVEASSEPPPTTSFIEDTSAPVVADRPDAGSNAFGVVVVVVLMVVALAVLKPRISSLSLAGVLGGAFDWAQLRSTEHDPIESRILERVDTQIDAARLALLDGDARNGIVACWMRLERGALDEGLPRLAAETSEEYARRIVASVSVDPAPLDDLADLYREARFSAHTLDERHRQRAADALMRVTAALDRRRKVE